MKMNRKETQLLVENWRNLINERGIRLRSNKPKGEQEKSKAIKLRSDFAKLVRKYNSSLDDENLITGEKIKISFTEAIEGNYPKYINDLKDKQFTLNNEGQMNERGLFIKADDKIYFSQFSVLDMLYLTNKSKRDDVIIKYMKRKDLEPEISKVISFSQEFEDWKNSDKSKFMDYLKNNNFTKVKSDSDRL